MEKDLLKISLTIRELEGLLGTKLYIVGGFVRDFLLKKQSNDIDLIHLLDIEEIVKKLNKVNIKFNDFGKKFGNLIVFFRGFKFDLMICRKDVACNGRKVIIKKSTLKEDLKRRDFTINAMALTSDFKLIDLLNGANDLKAKKLLFVGNPMDRIKEDLLRILRAFRFSINLNLSLCDFWKNFIVDKKMNLDFKRLVSKERIREEFKKCKNPNKMLQLCSKIKLRI